MFSSWLDYNYWIWWGNTSRLSAICITSCQGCKLSIGFFMGVLTLIWPGSGFQISPLQSPSFFIAFQNVLFEMTGALLPTTLKAEYTDILFGIVLHRRIFVYSLSINNLFLLTYAYIYIHSCINIKLNISSYGCPKFYIIIT